MKKTLILIVLLLTVATVTSCKEDIVTPEAPTVYGWYEIPLTSLDSASNKQLDSIFSKNNDLIPTKYTRDSANLYYVINSQNELNQINPFDFNINIDFSKYTIIGSRIINTSALFKFFSKILYKNDSLSRYCYRVSFYVPNPDDVVFGDFSYDYSWSVYSKLDSNCKMVFETAITDMSEK